MLTKPTACNGCLGHKWDDGDGFTHTEGTGRLGVHIVGEAAGKNEAVDGLPFRPYAQAGSILTQCIKRAEAGLDRSDFLIHNIVRCRPPNDLLAGQWFEQQVVDKCAIHRNKVFRDHPPKVILALGATAFRVLTGYSGEEKETLSMMRGYPLRVKLLGRNVWVVPSFHPAYIARGKRSLIPVLIHDIRRCLDVARKGWTITKKDYVLYPSIGDAKQFLQQVIAQPDAMLSFDLENPEMHDDSEDWKDDEEHAEDEHWEELKQDKERSQDKAVVSGKRYADIKTIQFSIQAGTGICLPWVGDYIPIAKQILALPNPKIGQNVYRYDLPVLRDKGVPVNGRIHDLMWMMHHLWPDLEGCYHLQGICSFHGGDEPWKHKATTNPEYYGCEDVSNPLRALPTITVEMKKAGVWHSYERHIVDLVKVLDRASLKGIGFDTEGSKVLSGELGEEMSALVSKMRELCPDEVRLSKQKEGYTRNPKDTEGMVQREFQVQEKVYSEYKVDCLCLDGKTKTGKVCQRCNGTRKRLKRVLEKSKKSGRESESLLVVTRYCSLKPFVPSNKQLIRYMEHQGHSVPKHARTSKPTTDERAMDLLIKRTGDPMYSLVKEYKGVQKLKSSYVDSWKTWSDGRIHTTFGFHPSSGQLNARDPNIQQLPKHKDIADRFRQLVIAPRSKWIVEMDYKSFHGMTCGFEAEDGDYMRLARMDLHSYLAADMVGKRADTRWDDKKLREYLEWIRKEHSLLRDTKAKRCIAEGELVLTNEGPVPIQCVNGGHLVWDGVEWVSHSGVIYQGERDVITYEGLTATPDHEVFLEDGRTIPFGEAASKMERIAQTGSAGEAIRFPHNHLLGSQTQERIPDGTCEVFINGKTEVELAGPYFGREIKIPQFGREEIFEFPWWLDRETIRRSQAEVHEQERQEVSFVWWERNPQSLQFPRALCNVGTGEFASSYLPWDRDRSKEQQWALRAGESEACNTERTDSESQEYGMGDVERLACVARRLRQSLRYSAHLQAGSHARDDGRAGNREREATRAQGEGENLATSPTVAHRTRVYDILNAGPRRRFTVSGKLVHNCVLGYQFGMTGYLLWAMNREVYEKQKEADEAIDRINTLFPKQVAYRNRTVDEAWTRKHLKTRYGYIRWFWDAKKYNPSKRTYVWSDDAKKAIAYRPANDAHGMMKEKMLEIERRGLNEKCGFLMPYHDALIFEMDSKGLDKYILEIKSIMETPDGVLVNKLCPNGLQVNVDVKIGVNLGKEAMKKWETIKQMKSA